MKLMQLMISLLAILTAGVAGVFTPIAKTGGPYSPWVEGVMQTVPGWQQVNSNGFGDSQVGEVSALEAFNGYLYAGTYNPLDPGLLLDGAQIFRSPDGVIWTPMTQPGFGNSHDIAPPAILDFIVFNNQLYASTGRGNASQIWRSSNGTIWAPMDVTGFSDPDNTDLTALAVYDGMIYAGVTNQVTGAQIWRSFTGDNNSWTQIAPTVPGTAPSTITGFATFGFDSGLYAAVESEGPAQIWRSFGGDWEIVVNDGFGDTNTLLTGGIAEFGGQLYVGAGNTTVGAQLWRTNDGVTWQQVITPGLGDTNNQEIEMVFVFQNQLYIGTKNSVTGIEIWRSADGMIWEQANPDGFGDSNNATTNGSNAIAVFLGQLYVGTSNIITGGELWRTIQLNNPPTDIALSNAIVDENQPANTVVGALTAIDPDAGATFTFSLACAAAGADDASFNILGTNLRTSAIFDFETKSAYNICVRVTDQGGLSFEENFVVTVNNLNEAPTDIALSNTALAENQPLNTVVGALAATDPDAGATFTFSLACAVAGADDGSFNILGTNLQTSTTFDFETKSSYSICIRVTDQGGLYFDKSFVVTVNDLNEVPTNISLSNMTVDENQPANMVVGALTATDPDAGAMFTFSLACAVAGADNASFNILGTNLRTSATFDFETKSIYNICIRVTDQGGLTFEKNFVITVNNVIEAPTDMSLSANSVDENQPANTVVGALTATNPEPGATFTFSLACAIPGVDDGSFNILGANLRTSANFDFEMKSTYNICIRVTDQGGLSFDKNFVITVNNVNEAPTDISLSANSVAENQPANTVVGALTVTDPDTGATFTFSLTCAAPGVDDGSFTVLGTNLQTSASFDFETKSIYNICLRVTDQGGLTFEKNFVVFVNNLNETPTSLSLSNTTVDENQPINTVVGILTATDPDAGTTFTFSLACAVAGTDDGSFNILGTDLRTSAAFDFETKSTYSLCLRVTDQGGLTFEENLIVSVQDLNEAPASIALSNATENENQPVNTVVGALTATDPDDGATFTFSLACAAPGADDGSFNIAGTDLRTSAIFDFETKSTYNLCIRVTDQGGLTFEENFVVTVNDVAENTSPTDISLSNTTVNENQLINTVVGALTATDPDADATFTFSLACTAPGADDGSFNISGTSLRTSAIFDFETKSTYTICMRVTDQGGLTLDRNFVITVNDLNEAPTDISLSANSVDENQPVNTLVGTLTATDPDAGATFTFSLACAAPGTDDSSFNILGTDLQTSATFDFETRSTYDICIRVTDQGGSSFEENFVINVKDLHEVTNTPGKVTGGGMIGSDQGKDKITFGFTIQYNDGDSAPKGNLTVQDHKTNLRLKVTSFDLLVIEGDHVWFTGTGIVDNRQIVEFQVEIDALSRLGLPDTFYLYLPALNGYEAGGALTGGNITIH